MRIPLILAITLSLSLFACGGTDVLDADGVLDLVPDAAAVSKSVLDEIREAGPSVSPRTLSTVPLSTLLMSATFEDSADLRRVPAAALTPTRISDMWKKASGGKVTMFPEDSLSDIVVETAGEEAKGSFRFLREGLLEGKVDFRAVRTDGDWQIVEFHLPGANATTHLAGDGTWQATFPD